MHETTDLNLVFGGPPMFLLNWIALTVGYVWLIGLVVGGSLLLAVTLKQKYDDARKARQFRRFLDGGDIGVDPKSYWERKRDAMLGDLADRP